ncbi:MAG: hypothetical protein HY703_05400 [Gemmatimonadetes bacterium]|nr:hypothetical protein [Gemmatimonadota bacterium]
MSAAAEVGARRLASAALALTGIIAATMFGHWMSLKGSPLVLVALIALAVIIAAALAVVTNWRLGLYTSLLWLTFEDLPRKFLGNNMVIYFGKDLLLVLVYVAFAWAVLSRRMRLLRVPFAAPLLIFVWFGALQVFNPNSPSLLYGFLGLRLYFFYIPLVFIGYALIRTERDLRQFLSVNLAVASIVALLGILQAVVGPSFLNPEVLPVHLRGMGASRFVPSTGEAITRPTSIFVSDGRFAWYVLLMFLLALGTSGYQFLRGGVRGKAVFAGLATSTVAVLLSASRGVLLVAGASAVALAIGVHWGLRRAMWARVRVSSVLRRAGIAMGVGLTLIVLMFPHQVWLRAALFAETMLPGGVQSHQLLWRLWHYPVLNFVNAFGFPNWLVGNGIGTASLGVQYVSSIFRVGSLGGWVESGYGTLVVEMGVLGPLIWLMWSSAYVYACGRVVMRLRGTAFFPLGLAIAWFGFLLLFPFTFMGMQPYQNYIFNAYLWLLTGVLYRLPQLAIQSELDAERRAQAGGPARAGYAKAHEAGRRAADGRALGGELPG